MKEPPVGMSSKDMLRSKSMDRDSFNSGDWFNRLDFTYQDTNWGVGLPVAGKNQDNWYLMAPLLADPALQVNPDDIQFTAAHFREMMAIRKSSGLFRLPDEASVIDRVSFLNTGPAQVPGMIVMVLADDDGSVDVLREVLESKTLEEAKKAIKRSGGGTASAISCKSGSGPSSRPPRKSSKR